MGGPPVFTLPAGTDSFGAPPARDRGQEREEHRRQLEEQQQVIPQLVIAGNGSTPTDDIEKVTGRPPATFREFVKRNARVWALEEK